MIMRKASLDFIGVSFSTPKDGKLTVVEAIPRVTKGPVKFICTCSICSEDQELWPYGSISSTKGHLEEGKFPCGCTKVSKYNEAQYSVLVSRKLATKGCEFLGWSGRFLGPQTLVRVYNPTYEVCWWTRNIFSILYSTGEGEFCVFSCMGRQGIMPSERLSQLLSIEPFYSNYQLAPLDWFFLNKARSAKYSWKCGICKEEGYIFLSSLLKGRIPCYCNSCRVKNSEISKMKACVDRCNQEGLVLHDSYKFSSNIDNVVWSCKNGHKNFTSYNNFTIRKSGCKLCLKGNSRNGFYEKRKQEKDNLYVIRLSDGIENFIKIGRSFNVKNRIYTYKCKYSVELLGTYSGPHLDIFYTEQYHLFKYSHFKYLPSKYSVKAREFLDIECLDSLMESLSNIYDIEPT